MRFGFEIFNGVIVIYESLMDIHIIVCRMMRKEKLSHGTQEDNYLLITK